MRGPSGVLQSLEYTYDADGQRTKIVREDGTRIYFSYDLARRLTGDDRLDPSDPQRGDDLLQLQQPEPAGLGGGT